MSQETFAIVVLVTDLKAYERENERDWDRFLLVREIPTIPFALSGCGCDNSAGRGSGAGIRDASRGTGCGSGRAGDIGNGKGAALSR